MLCILVLLNLCWFNQRSLKLKFVLWSWRATWLTVSLWSWIRKNCCNLLSFYISFSSFFNLIVLTLISIWRIFRFLYTCCCIRSRWKLFSHCQNWSQWGNTSKSNNSCSLKWCVSRITIGRSWYSNNILWNIDWFWYLNSDFMLNRMIGIWGEIFKIW